MKRFTLRLFVWLVIISMLITPLWAYGFEKEGEGEARLLQEGNYEIEASSSHYSAKSDSYQGVRDYIYQQLLLVTGSVSLADFNIPVSDIDALYSDVINDNPDLFYVSSSYSFSYYYDGTVARVTPKYAMTEGEIENAREIFNSGTLEALSEVDSSMSDLQKALTLHDYICSKANYPTVYDENGYFVESLDKDIYHSAYGFFLNQTVVCAGYTLAYSYLLNQLGIPCEYVASDDMSHAWNKVYIDGSWYNADLTFDDSDDRNDETTYGSMLHSYFLKSDEYFAGNASIAWHYGGITYDDCAAVSTLYDNAFWNDVTSRIYTVGGDFYYLDPPSSSSVYVFLKKRTPGGSETNLCSGFSTVSLTYSGAFFDENGTQHVYSFKDFLARLSYLDGRFYVAAGRNLCSVLLNGTKYTITSLSNYSTGLAKNANGNLIYHLYADNNNLNEIDKLDYFNSHITYKKGVNYNNYPDVNLDGVINGRDYAKIYSAQNS